PKTLRVLHAESVDVDTAHFGSVDVIEASRPRLPGIDGIIGLNLFRGLVVTLDYPKSRFRLSGGSLPAAEAMSYTAEHGVPRVEIDVNGRTIKVDIDARVRQRDAAGAHAPLQRRGVDVERPVRRHPAAHHGRLRGERQRLRLAQRQRHLAGA